MDRDQNMPRYMAIGYYTDNDESTVDYIEAESVVAAQHRLHDIRRAWDWKFLLAYTPDELREHAANIEAESSQSLEECIQRIEQCFNYDAIAETQDAQP